MYIAAAAHRRRLRLRRDRHPVPAGIEGPAAGLRPGRGHAQQRRSSAGHDRDGKPIRDGQALLHFNEVDECAGLDALITYRVHRALGQPVETTLHDIRWGDSDRSGTAKDYVWVFEITGAAPPAHFIGGWSGRRQRAAAGACTSASAAARSRDLQAGRDRLVARLRRRRQLRWTLAGPASSSCPRRRRSGAGTHDAAMADHARRAYGVSRDQLMARHKANHIQVAYANPTRRPTRRMAAKAALAAELGPRSVAVRRQDRMGRRCFIEARHIWGGQANGRLGLSKTR